MKRPQLRSGLITATLLIVLAAGWLYLAPTQLGGSTAYVVTKGNSMEPLFRSGDLAIVRPVDHYRVGQIVAYHSTLLHVVVLHRLIAISGNSYVFKGDHNTFVDPVAPSRSELVGALWVHVPHAGRVLLALHSPLVAALVAAVAGVVLLGVREKRRRRRRRRGDTTGSDGKGTAVASIRNRGLPQPANLRGLFLATAAAAVAFLALGLFAFTRPTRKAATQNLSYTQSVKLGYSASARAGAVYPDGIVHTGEPIYLRLVHRLRFRIDYRLSIAGKHRLSGIEAVVLQIANSTGWSRSVQLAAPQRFAGDRFTTQVTLDVTRVQALLQQVQAMTGASGGDGTIAITPSVDISGTIAGRSVRSSYSPEVEFQLTPLQLTVAGSGGSRNSASSAMTPSRQSILSVAATKASTVGIGGARLPIAALRWISFLGLLLTGICAIVSRALLKLAHPLEEATRIQAKYGHLIVPVVAPPYVESSEPFDVTSIDALVRLAQSGDRLILHHRDGFTDAYLVSDDTALYRYRTEVPVIWGEWSAPRQPPVLESSEPNGEPVDTGTGSGRTS